MESETWKGALDKHLPELTERLPSVIDDVIRRIKRHISHNEYLKIKSITDPADKIEELLNAIRSRTLQDFYAFCEALVAVKQNDLAEKLKHHSNITESCTSMTIYKEDLKHSYRGLPLVSVDDTFGRLPSQYISLLLHKIEQKDIRKSMLSGYVDELLIGKSSMSLPAMFDVKEVNKKVILVEGGPGMGKSTLAVKICKCWAEGGLLENYDAVILVPLRDPEIQKAESISDLLQMPDEELREKVYKEAIKTKGKRICFIFEGYDELPPHLRDEPVFAKLMDKLPECTLVYTSRPEACRALYALVSRRINILGFEEAQIFQYIENVFDDNKEQAKALISQVKQNHLIRNIMSTPINVAIICHIFSNLCCLPNTLTELYNYLCIHLIVRHVCTRAHTCKGEDVWFDSLDDLPSEIQEEFNGLCFMAYKGREKGQVVFSSKELKTYLVIEKKVSGLGLLLIAPSVSSNYGRERSYNFLHLTLQEFCAAKYISRMPPTQQLNCFKSHHCNSNFNMIWKFYSGITKLKNNEVFSSMLPSKQVNSPYGRRKTVDLLHYVYEANSEEHFVRAGNHISGTIYFRGCDVDHISCNSLSNLLVHSNEPLKEFDFSGCQLSELSLTIVCNSLMKKFKMQKCQDSGFDLDVSYNRVTDASLSLVTDIIKQNFPLSSLNLGDCDIRGEISTLCESCKINMTLTKLIIPSCSLDATVMPILCKMLEHNHSLKTLDLSRNDIGPEGTLCLVGAKNITIANLILHKCKQDSTGATNIGKFLTKNTSVVFVDLSFNAIGDNGVKELMNFLRANNTLQHLDLKSNKITSTGAVSICGYLMGDSPSLTNIVVAKNPLENGICRIIEAVKSNNVLKEIDFTQTTTMLVLPSDMEKIICKLSSLKFSPLDDTIIKGLDRTSTLQNLQVLRGTDYGYRTVINSMQENKSVERLDFQHNQLSKDTISDLSLLVKHSTVLKELILNCTRVELSDWFILAEGLVVNRSLKEVMIGAFPIELDQLTTMKFLDIIQQNLTIEELLLRITQEDIQDKQFMHEVEVQVDKINQYRNLHKALPLHVEIL